MPRTNSELDIWQRLIKHTEQKPMNFHALSSQYDINKLELEKITALELKAKKKEFQQRHWDQNQEQSKSWLQNQYRLFIWFILAYMKFFQTEPEKFTQQDWNLIGNCFKKYPYVCKYFCFSCKKQKSEQWTQQEDQFIQQMMASYLNKKWTGIGLELYRVTDGKKLRKPKAIRERWLSHLNPEIKRTDWTFDQQYYLIQKIKEYGKKWSKIAKQLGNRSEHTVKNRFNKIVLKFSKRKQINLREISDNRMLQLVEQQYRKKKQQKENRKKQKAVDNIKLQEPLNPSSSQLIKNQNETLIDFNQFRSTTIFTPIIIMFGGFKMS